MRKMVKKINPRLRPVITAVALKCLKNVAAQRWKLFAGGVHTFVTTSLKLMDQHHNCLRHHQQKIKMSLLIMTLADRWQIDVIIIMITIFMIIIFMIIIFMIIIFIFIMIMIDRSWVTVSILRRTERATQPWTCSVAAHGKCTLSTSQALISSAASFASSSML